jgi:siroheme synthase-like protein
VSTGITQNIYPVGLLLEGQPCLIVGGGKVAARKTEGLLEAEATVTVISPELDAHLARLAADGSITHIARAYEADDTTGYALVFAATGDRKVNRTVLEECRAKRIPCCPVDGNWMDGDFVTPAIIRKGPLSVAISTGGQNCRRSRLIKENLARHLDMVDSADLVVIGTSHQELPLQQRDSLQLQGERLKHIGNMLLHVWGLHEFMLLSTCNRIELLAVKATDADTGSLIQRILGFDTLATTALYVKTGLAAFEHTAMLASGLLSQAAGEYHIVAQIKASLALATQRQWSGGMIKEWIDAALHISKKIRQTMPHDWLQGEIEDVAIQYLQNVPLHGQPPTGLALPLSAVAAKREGGSPFNPPASSLSSPRPSTLQPLPSILVIGTGTIGTGIVTRLAKLDIACHWVYHHNPPATTPANVSLHPWSDLEPMLRQSECIITAVATPEPIIIPEMKEPVCWSSRPAHRSGNPPQRRHHASNRANPTRRSRRP